jgi:hypothetical protein
MVVQKAVSRVEHVQRNRWHINSNYLPKPNPPQLHLLEGWNTQTSLDGFETQPNSQLQEPFTNKNPSLHDNPAGAVTAALTGSSWPFSPFAFVTLNTERTNGVTMKSVASTK